MARETLTLRKPPDPSKVSLAERMLLRFVERKGNRYILQGRVPCPEKAEETWVDIPLVPEVYGA